MKISTNYLLGISNAYQEMAKDGKLTLLSDDSIISLEEIQFAMSVILDLKVGRVVISSARFQEYTDDMIDICVNAYRNKLSEEATSSLVKEKYHIEFKLTANESLMDADIKR